MRKLASEQIDSLQEALHLPDTIAISDYLGSGARADVFRGTLDGQDVVIKAYQRSAAEKYWRRYRVDIAEFEFQRNTALFDIDTLRPHIARPYCVFSQDSDYTHALVQQWVEGERLSALYRRQGFIPDDLIHQGFAIVGAASKADLYDLDINAGNIFVINTDGTAKLMLCDFNMVPQHLYPPNPFLWLAYRLRIRPKSYRDERNLRKWLQRRKPGSPDWPMK